MCLESISSRYYLRSFIDKNAASGRNISVILISLPEWGKEGGTPLLLTAIQLPGNNFVFLDDNRAFHGSYPSSFYFYPDRIGSYAASGGTQDPYNFYKEPRHFSGDTPQYLNVDCQWFPTSGDITSPHLLLWLTQYPFRSCFNSYLTSFSSYLTSFSSYLTSFCSYLISFSSHLVFFNSFFTS